ncbi:hypothetical protein [Photobacterium leiognathi]|uniref:hypothetical protein n=1 Tax=Photobacterium leiognathi TaxID=553611 RepID=UPI0029822BC5|nr:hypothetical protein [Photobacterium leiognathi]
MYPEKLVFNENDNMFISYLGIIDKNNFISDDNLSRCDLVQYFSSNDIDPAIMNHLYGIVFNYSDDFHGRIPTIGEFIKKNNRECKGIGLDLNHIFSGVNKSLICPLMVVKGVSVKRSTIEIDESLNKNLGYNDVVGYHPDEVLRFNPKNITKLLNYPKSDAKALFRNINYLCQELYLPLIQRLDERIHTIGICHFVEPAMHCWHLKGLMTMENISEELRDAALDSLEKIFKDVPLPINNLKLWRLITKEWYEREKGGEWNKLSSQAQRRHLVNMIRHGSIGYSQCYTNLPSNLANLLHEAAFNRIMRQIANTFPFLRNECQRQWNYREKNNLSWSSIEV